MVTGQQLKLKGMSLAANKRQIALDTVRGTMMLAPPLHGEFTSDLAQQIAAAYHLDLGNAAGSVFKTDDWEFTGRWVPSQRPEAHGRFIRVWRLKK